MNAITQAIVNHSTLDITYIRITDASKDSFLISLQGNVANTGPIGVTLTEMSVDMCGAAGMFGKLSLPEIRTTSSGAVITINDQRIQILDMDAFLAFNKSIMGDEETILRLQNGHTTAKTFMLSVKLNYSKEVIVKGMNGPKTSIVKTEIDGSQFKNTILFTNPSPLEIDLGTVKHEIRNQDGVKIGEQKGRLFLNRGETTFHMTGTTTGVKANGDAVLVGLGVDEDAWTNEAILNFKANVRLTDELVALCSAH